MTVADGRFAAIERDLVDPQESSLDDVRRKYVPPILADRAGRPYEPEGTLENAGSGWFPQEGEKI